MSNSEQTIMVTVTHGKYHAKRNKDGHREVHKVGGKPFLVSVNTANNFKDALKPVSVSAAEHAVAEAATAATEQAANEPNTGEINTAAINAMNPAALFEFAYQSFGIQLNRDKSNIELRDEVLELVADALNPSSADNKLVEDDILDQSVAHISSKLGDMDLNELESLLARENAGKTRTTLVKDITSAMSHIMDNDDKNLGDGDE